MEKIPSAPVPGAPLVAPPRRQRRASRPGDLVDVFGWPLEPMTPPAPAPLPALERRCVNCGQVAVNELGTCGRWECGRF